MTAFMQPRQGDQGGGVMNRYEEFLARKAQLSDAGGFTPDHVPDHLFDMSGAVVSA